MNTERLLRLADHLDTVPESAFDLMDWACGTTACAVGHACFIPEFMAAGLRMDFIDGGLPIPSFGNCYGWMAAGVFFDLPPGASVKLFDPDYYSHRAKPQDVAARIRQFVGVTKPVIQEGEMPAQKAEGVKNTVPSGV
jgi:hypothetical protein